ncbi:MAG TPA: hypothetical protein DIT67_06670 [Octadecabacter sp.]|nr:hypothetical protein [Octadecabacter sp.]
MRNLQVIRDNGLAPEANQWMPDNLYDLTGLVHFALIGAFLGAGLPLLHAAKMSQEMRWMHYDFGFGYMSGLRNFSHDEIKKLDVWTPGAGNYEFEFWLHHALKSQGIQSYSGFNAWDYDKVLLIADGALVSIDLHNQKHKMNMVWGKNTVPFGPDPFCRILPKNDPSNKLIQPVIDDPRINMDTGEFSLDVINEYRDAIYNSTSLLRINMSLATRKCADRIHDLRMNKGGTIFQS